MFARAVDNRPKVNDTSLCKLRKKCGSETVQVDPVLGCPTLVKHIKEGAELLGSGLNYCVPWQLGELVQVGARCQDVGSKLFVALNRRLVLDGHGCSSGVENTKRPWDRSRMLT